MRVFSTKQKSKWDEHIRNVVGEMPIENEVTTGLGEPQSTVQI